MSAYIIKSLNAAKGKMGIFQITIFFHKHTLHRHFTSPRCVRACFGRHIHFNYLNFVNRFVFVTTYP